MNDKTIVRKALELRKISQQELAKLAGYKSQSNIASILNRNTKGMRTDNFVTLLSAMNYEVVVFDKTTGNKMWTVTTHDETDSTGWIIGENKTFVCPDCGTVFEEKTKFCPNCGHKFNI